MSRSFRTYVLEQLKRVRPDVRDRSMFGGWASMPATSLRLLIADDTLYFKVDDSNRPAFEERGLGPFMPTDPRASVMCITECLSTSWRIPKCWSSWAEQAIEVARNKRTRKRQR